MKPPNLQHLMMDAALLLPLTGTPLTGIEFYKRLPCGEVEHTRRVSCMSLCRSLFSSKESDLTVSSETLMSSLSGNVTFDLAASPVL